MCLKIQVVTIFFHWGSPLVIIFLLFSCYVSDGNSYHWLDLVHNKPYKFECKAKKSSLVSGNQLGEK